MRHLKPAMIVIAVAMALLASGTASADRYSGGGDLKGSYYSGGSHEGGRYGGWSGYHGSYYRGGVGVVFGGPYWGPSWYYPSYYYPYDPYSFPYSYYPSVSEPSSPPVYIEQPQSEPDSAPQGVWYYCPDSKTYYPYVKECPGGWQTVPAQPPSEQGR
jgi:hypothetical protein